MNMIVIRRKRDETFFPFHFWYDTFIANLNKDEQRNVSCFYLLFHKWQDQSSNSLLSYLPTFGSNTLSFMESATFTPDKRWVAYNSNLRMKFHFSASPTPGWIHLVLFTHLQKEWVNRVMLGTNEAGRSTGNSFADYDSMHTMSREKVRQCLDAMIYP